MVFAVSGSATTNTHCVSSLQARAAFPGYCKQPSSVSVPALQRSFSVNVGWSSGRFMLGMGWGLLISAAGLRPGDRVQLSKTGTASFELVKLVAAAAGQDAEQVADERPGALTWGCVLCLLHCGRLCLIAKEPLLYYTRAYVTVMEIITMQLNRLYVRCYIAHDQLRRCQ